MLCKQLRFNSWFVNIVFLTKKFESVKHYLGAGNWIGFDMHDSNHSNYCFEAAPLIVIFTLHGFVKLYDFIPRQ